MALVDPHSYADDTQPRTKHLRLHLAVDFERKRIDGRAVLELAAPAGGPMDLDTKGLTIVSVTSSGGGEVLFDLGPEDPILGRRLTLKLPPATTEVLVRYSTSPDAIGLQWLEPAQTEGKRHPFLFSQCQAIHARTMVPCQDTARFRVTYHAEVTVPRPLSAVMSAGPSGTIEGKGTRTFLFDMPQPIPTYLLALAVGELESRDLSPRARVWAEPSTVEKAAWEFAGVEEKSGDGEVVLDGQVGWLTLEFLAEEQQERAGASPDVERLAEGLHGPLFLGVTVDDGPEDFFGFA